MKNAVMYYIDKHIGNFCHKERESFLPLMSEHLKSIVGTGW